MTRIGMLTLLALAAGCTSVPAEDGRRSDFPEAEIPAREAEAPAPRTSSDLLFKVLVAEMATRRNQLSLALATYLDLARETGDPEVAERAVRVAVFARDYESGLEASRLWVESSPDSIDALQVHSALLVRANRVDEAVTSLGELVRQVEARFPGNGFDRVADMLARERERDRAVEVMEKVVAEHDGDAEAQYAFANLLARVGEYDHALERVARVLAIDPSHERAMVLNASVLRRKGDTTGAMEALGRALELDPDSDTIRKTYARLLVDARRYDEALAQFETLAEHDPADLDVRHALGLLLLQTNRLDESRVHFEVLAEDIERRYTAYYYLGQIAENQKDFERSLETYRKVDRGEHRLNAQIRVAVLMAEQGDVARARAHLQTLRSDNNREAIRVIRAEAEILSRAEDLAGAKAVYDNALDEFPQDTDLLYARAMLAEKMGLLDILEQDLRDVLTREPNNGDALNALGYTLADRTDRLDEALDLIQRAYDLKPDDHYVVDSLGWVLYRLGRHQEALKHLRRAMTLNPDPEVAAHLGEVLWAVGDREEAREVWDTALQGAPGDKRLLDVKKRFGL